MNIRILSVPYDSGHRRARMGCGPERILAAGIENRLRAHGHHLAGSEEIVADDRFPAEIKTTFELLRHLSERVHAAVAGGAFPLVLAGNCNSAVGAVAGLDSEPVGLVWFDAHGEFNTPETTTSGFLDGMGLAMATGRCWRSLSRTIPGFRPLEERNVLLAGVRDLDHQEAEALAASGIKTVSAGLIRQAGATRALGSALAEMATRVRMAYVHIDLDVLDPAEARANEYPAPGGLTVQHVVEGLAAVAQHLTLCGAGLASYDPACDEDDQALGAALSLLEELAAATGRRCSGETIP